jgi:hypothetical protein
VRAQGVNSQPQQTRQLIALAVPFADVHLGGARGVEEGVRSGAGRGQEGVIFYFLFLFFLAAFNT